MVHFNPLSSTFNHFPRHGVNKKLTPLFAATLPTRKLCLRHERGPASARSTIARAFSLSFAQIAFSQAADKTVNNTVRMAVSSVKADGPRMVYKFDDARHKAVATTTGPDGKVREKIRYELDDVGRFSSGLIFGPDGQLRLKSLV